VADHHQHGESEHDQRDMAMPAVPASGLVVVEAQQSRFAPLAGALAAVMHGDLTGQNGALDS